MGLKHWIPAGVRQQLKSFQRGVTGARKQFIKRLTRPNLYGLHSPERVGVVFTAPSDMKIDERLYLYALIRSFRPERALEIGVLAGGSGCIIANAMEDNGKGIIVGVDPDPHVRIRKRNFHGRYHVVAKPSPEGLSEAHQIAGGNFDFVFIDGLHLYDQVVRDIDGVLPLLCDGGTSCSTMRFTMASPGRFRWRLKPTPGCTIAGIPVGRRASTTIRLPPITACASSDTPRKKSAMPIRS